MTGTGENISQCTDNIFVGSNLLFLIQCGAQVDIAHSEDELFDRHDENTGIRLEWIVLSVFNIRRYIQCRRF